MRTLRLLVAALLGVALSPGASPVVVHAQNGDGITVFLRRLEPIVQAGDVRAFRALLTNSADRSRADDFTTLQFAAASRTVIQERDREPLPGTLPGDGFRLILDVFTEYGNRSRVATWRLDLKRIGQPGEEQEWGVADEERLSSLESLYRLS
ncbi:MAG TPA: hypothetical protein VF219_14600, partial [Vicinamibacterales bacterium]